MENEKGFLLIKASREQIAKIGGMGICDNCGEPASGGVYIAVLNQWFCDKCFQEWYKDAVRYEEDSAVERRNYEFYKNMLGL